VDALFVLVPLLVFAGFAVVAVVLVAVFRSGSDVRLPADPAQPFTLQARVLRPDEFDLTTQFDPATYGQVTVTGDRLLWAPEQGSGWAAPLDAVTVQYVADSEFTAAQPSVDLDIAGSGPWRVVVSNKRINRLVANDAKRFREARVARQFADALLQRGASPRRAPAPGTWGAPPRG
jgi:hypothetical protein